MTSETERVYNYDLNDDAKFCLEIDICHAEVTIKQSDSAKVDITLYGNSEDMDEIKVSQYGTTITIKQILHNILSSGNGSVIYNNGGIIASGNNTVVIGGCFISGNQYYQGTNNVVKNKTPVNITINCPTDLDFDFSLSGRSKCNSTVKCNNLFLDTSGISTFSLEGANNPKISCAGSSKGFLDNQTGNIKVKSSGSSDVKITGQFDNIEARSSGSSGITIGGPASSIEAISSGSSSISTFGNCKRDYLATASGASSVTHFGEIGGRTREKRSGAASIKIN